MTSFPQGRDLPAVAALNDLIIVGPGSLVPSRVIDVYQTKEQTWRAPASVARMTYERAGASSVAAGNRYYFICGGSGVNDLGSQEVRCCWCALRSFYHMLCHCFCGFCIVGEGTDCNQ